ncbi:MAG: hypothetical protein JWM16_1629 [Verrucomicrobiales bacterium]|nr:hypothetical protein [Verrucomicrobiales bacterium]
MTVVADSEKRVLLPVAQPGDSFDLRVAPDGTLMLFRLAQAPSMPAVVKVELRNGFSVGVLDQPIDEEVLKQALDDFP